MNKKKIQLIEREVTRANSLIRISEDLDRNYDRLTGIAFLHTIGSGHLLQSMTVDSMEIFPRGFEVAFLQSNSQVAPKDRFFPLNETAQGKKIEIDFQDNFISYHSECCLNQNNNSNNDNSGYSNNAKGDYNGDYGGDYDGSQNNNGAVYPYTLKIYLELTND
ncbi:hypothetical protein NBT05_12390 [Aquimarina sp. ERC-38]|uniref:hypothetical protein n=1 Tax=Aquimarina sp. ERC-38 TaxID=2949996 RepID=UPI002247A94D|nr:hypothetical protein [Aquimarina sp. ERC-38]UZO79747.1 hypothetical protein NBT05_12390 [Aquimarina sp. ERC-38]